MFSVMICVYVCLILIVCLPIEALVYEVSEYIGASNSSGGFQGDGGPALQALVKQPSGVWMSSVRELFVADRNNYRVRKVDYSGMISTFAGTDISTSDSTVLDISSATSVVLRPFGVCGNANGVIYIVENPNSRVYQVDIMTSVLSILAGTGSASSDPTAANGDGGSATAATFYYPTYCAVDTSGTVYIASANEYKVRSVTASSGIISTVAGIGVYESTGDGGPATSATLKLPYSLYVDRTAMLFIGSYNGRKVRNVDLSSGIINTFAGNGIMGANAGDDGPATSATLNGIPFVTGDTAGRVFIAVSNRVRMVDTVGIIDTVAGSDGAGYNDKYSSAISTLFNDIRQITSDSYGRVYLPERGNNIVRVLSPVAVSLTEDPTLRPTIMSTMLPTTVPSDVPTESPSVKLTVMPTLDLTTLPTFPPTLPPTISVSGSPTRNPTIKPSMMSPTMAPFDEKSPSLQPINEPTSMPSNVPSEDDVFIEVTEPPTDSPTVLDLAPTEAPFLLPTEAPFLLPSEFPTIWPTEAPFLLPSEFPTIWPTEMPTVSLTLAPTVPPVTIAFNSTLYLHNVTSISLDSVSQYVVKIAVASTLQLRYDSVDFVSQSTLPMPVMAVNFDIAVVVLVTASEQSIVSTSDAMRNASQNATLFYWQLRDILAEATSSTTFVHTVRTYSALYGAYDTLYVSNVTAAVSSYTPVNTNPNVIINLDIDYDHALVNWIIVTPILMLLFACIIIVYIAYRVMECVYVKYFKVRNVYHATPLQDVENNATANPSAPTYTYTNDQKGRLEVTILGIGEL